MSMFGHVSAFSAPNEWKLIDLLESSNVTIEQLLDDESIVSIARTNNTKLIEFILRPKNFHQLISYLITEPQEIIRPKRRNNHSTHQTKLPFISCELLSNDIDWIMNKLLENPVLLQGDTDTIPDDSSINSDSESKRANFSTEIKQSNEIESNNYISMSNGEETSKVNGQLDEEIQTEKKTENNGANRPILQPMMSELTENSGEKYNHFATASLIEYDIDDEIILCPVEQLLSILNDKPPLNPTMCGYVSKVLKNLFTNKPIQLANLLLETLFPQFKKILNHLYNDSLSELLQLLIKMESLISSDTVQGTRRSEIILMLANSFSTPIYKVLLDEDIAQDYLDNISSIFSVWFGSFKQLNGGSKVLKPLLRNIYITPLVFIIQNASNPQLKAISRYISSFCLFLKELISAEETDTIQDSPQTKVSGQQDTANTSFGYNGYKSNSNNIESVTNYESIFTELGKIIECGLRIIHENRQQEPMVTFPAGYSSSLIGHKRYYLYEMIAAVLKLDGEVFERGIISGAFFETSLEILEQNCWGNILHSLIYKMLEFIIESRWYEQSKVALLNQADLIGFIVRETKDPLFKHPSKMGASVVKGHIAYLMKLANLLHKSEDESIRRLIKANESYPKWVEFVDTELKSYNKKDSTRLGDTDPKAGISPRKVRMLRDSESAIMNGVENIKEDEPNDPSTNGTRHHQNYMLIEKESSQETNGHFPKETVANNRMHQEDPFDSHMETKFLSPDLWDEGGAEQVITEKRDETEHSQNGIDPATNVDAQLIDNLDDPESI